MKTTYMKYMLLGAVAGMLSLTSCEGYLDTTPSNAVGEDGALTSLADAKLAMNGAYYHLIDEGFYGCDFIAFAEVGGEDMQTASRSLRTENFYRYLYRQNNSPSGLWFYPYEAIRRANAIILAIENGSVPAGEGVDAVKGEALALRALCYFDLLRTYGVTYTKDNGASLGVPLTKEVLGKDALPERATVAAGYEMVIGDLEAAKDLLSDQITDGSGQISASGRFNHWAVKALLARVYLTQGDFESAYTYAKDVVENSPYSLVSNENYIASWTQNHTSEAILDIEITDLASGNRELWGYVVHPTGYKAVIPTQEFIDLLGEDAKDVRNKLFAEYEIDDEGTKQTFYMKYAGRNGQPAVNNVHCLRLSDVYLMAAEAALKKPVVDQTTADDYLDAIRKRANPEAAKIAATVAEVLKERRKELAMEGHRLFDILRNDESVKREGGFHNLDQTNLITVSRDDYRVTMPIPQAEIDANPNIEQNPEY